MVDIIKLKEGLAFCAGNAICEDDDRACPYRKRCATSRKGNEPILSDALIALNELSEGNWVEHLHKYAEDRNECSFCHIYSSLPTPYCPYCGTKMLRIVKVDD